MVAKNDITQDELTTGHVSDDYRKGFDAIDWSVKRVDCDGSQHGKEEDENEAQ